MPASESNSLEFSARHLHRRYVVSLSLVAILTLLSQGAIQLFIVHQVHDSHLVNIAGRQRMLSQKIAKTLYFLAGEEKPALRDDAYAQLKETLALWERSHAGLQNGDAELALPGNNSAQVTRLFEAIEPNHRAVVTAAHEVLATPGSLPVLRRATRQVSANEPNFLTGMDDIVFRYAAEAKEKIRFAEYLGLGLALLILLILVLEARFIIAPAIGRLRRDMRERQQREADMQANITELENAQQTLQYYATFDEMTGLLNRRTGLMFLEKALERVKRQGAPLIVCYADIDGLKTTNDKYGHHEGDWMIRTVSKVLIDSIRKGDTAVRLGGDEFMLMLQDCDEQNASLLLERIEQRLDEFSTSESKPFALKMSIGVARYDPVHHANTDALIAEADGKMYAAKLAKKIGPVLNGGC